MFQHFLPATPMTTLLRIGIVIVLLGGAFPRILRVARSAGDAGRHFRDP
jgi:hypothetical protein